MIRAILIAMIFLMSISTNLYAVQSTITEAEGYSCAGDDKSRKQTEQEALVDAKRVAVENAVSYVKSETKVKDFQIEKDMVQAYSNAAVNIIEVKEKKW